MCNCIDITIVMQETVKLFLEEVYKLELMWNTFVIFNHN
jgi:hypothetical protein